MSSTCMVHFQKIKIGYAPKFMKILFVTFQMAEFPNQNIDNGSQCNVQKNAPNAKHRLCIKLMKVAKILYKTESF